MVPILRQLVESVVVKEGQDATPARKSRRARTTRRSHEVTHVTIL